MVSAARSVRSAVTRSRRAAFSAAWAVANAACASLFSPRLTICAFSAQWLVPQALTSQVLATVCWSFARMQREPSSPENDSCEVAAVACAAHTAPKRARRAKRIKTEVLIKSLES